MVKISNVRVFGLDNSIKVSGYPMQIDNVSESLGKGIKRCERLCKPATNSGHSNFLKGIIVQFDIVYPQYFSPQLQRYNFIDIISSQSKMHRLKAFPIKDSVNKYVSKDSIRQTEHHQCDYNEVLDEIKQKTLIASRSKEHHVKSKLSREIRELENLAYEKYMVLVSNLPSGFELKMGITTNYLQLKNIFHQRKNHKLKEDWGAFNDMIRNLPHFDKFIWK